MGLETQRLAVVIPTLNAARSLAASIASLAPARALVAEVVISDGGSSDGTRAIAETNGARVIDGARGRGAQLRLGADATSAPWLLFLHADTALEESWTLEAARFLDEPGRAAVFTLRFDTADWRARAVERGAMWRTKILAAPYGDQGLLISRSLYNALGGYRPLALFEDVDLVDRLIRARGRGALYVFQSRATTSAARYERDGWIARVLRNQVCLALYRSGAPIERIARVYEGR